MKLIVIDMQKALLVDELYAKNKLIKNIKNLIDVARENYVEVIYVKHDGGMESGMTRGDVGFGIIDELKPMNGEKVFVKELNSAFSSYSFKRYLRSKNERDLIIVGLQTEFCIDATIKSAVVEGYDVYIPDCCHSTFDNEYLKAKKICKYYNEWIWQGNFAEVRTLDEIIKFIKHIY